MANVDPPVFELHECGVDWLTATVRPGTNATALTTVAWAWQQDRANEGYEVKPWRWNGYDGDTVDGLTLAKRDDGTIIRLSGDMARRHWLVAMNFADNVSRIDLQATILDVEKSLDWGVTGYSRAQQAEMVQSGTTSLKLTVNRPKGSTLNIGSRVSSRFFRLYDKHAETKGEYADGTWRWEIEYKGDRAWRLARRLAASKNQHMDILSVLDDAYFDYKIQMPIAVLPYGWREKAVKRTTDDQRRLEWLRRCIRPTILKLSECYSAETVAEALGLYGIIDEVKGYIESWSEVDLPTKID
ncbi:MAG TPA: replication initiation factor domain-containing protein [Nitrospiraceae bacterium]|nr:replication initiation factor domain-containing protein [Nitrospiraceae bacterium]